MIIPNMNKDINSKEDIEVIPPINPEELFKAAERIALIPSFESSIDTFTLLESVEDTSELIEEDRLEELKTLGGKYIELICLVNSL